MVALVKDKIESCYFYTCLTGLFSFLTLHELLFAIGTIISIIYTIRTFNINRREKKLLLEEEKKRTRLMHEYLQRHADDPCTLKRVNDSLKEIDNGPKK